ncbi:hypothetical protein [Streptomyces sp. QHH-9511]|uniref:hypothetical protein n=1 Tax=Streptomyces sp. QHH-9511 TaxID=2684468 RepID=UPI002FCD3631
MSIGDSVRLNEILECGGCRSELEIVALDPMVLALAPTSKRTGESSRHRLWPAPARCVRRGAPRSGPSEKPRSAQLPRRSQTSCSPSPTVPVSGRQP